MQYKIETAMMVFLIGLIEESTSIVISLVDYSSGSLSDTYWFAAS